MVFKVTSQYNLQLEKQKVIEACYLSTATIDIYIKIKKIEMKSYERDQYRKNYFNDAVIFIIAN